MHSSVPATRAQSTGRLLSTVPRTVLAGALGFALVFSIGAAPVNAQDTETHPGTEQLAASTVDEPMTAGPATEPSAAAADSHPADLIDAGPSTEPAKVQTEPTPAPPAEPAPEQFPGNTATTPPMVQQPQDAPAAPPVPVAPSSEAKPQPADTSGVSPVKGTPTPDPSRTAPPETPEMQIEGPGAHMGMGLSKATPALTAGTRLASSSRILSELEVPRAAAAPMAVAAAAPMVVAAAVGAAVGAAVAAVVAAAAPKTPAGIPGMDVSGWQADSGYTRSTVNWAGEWSKGSRFVYVKATEGSGFIDKSRTSHLAGATRVGMLHGAYHFALPGQSTATAQADHFVRNGGAWTADGKTLPPLLDIENNPYGANCYGLSQGAMVSWIQNFSNRVQAQTGRLPMIYTNYYWWQECTGGSKTFTNQPLHIAAYGASSPWIPGGWATYSMWQFSSTGPFAGDSNVWNGTLASLTTFAAGTTVTRVNGQDRYEVSAGVSKSAFQPGVRTAYIASGAVYSDALSGSAAAGITDSPVLLTGMGVLPDVIRAELTRLKPQRIVVLGGPASVSDSVVGLLKKYSPSVSRISGQDRYVVSAAVSKSTFNAGTNTAYIASGAIYTDALSGSALAGHQGGPVLLTAPTVLPDAIRAELARLQPQRIVILGGSGSVSDSVMNLLNRYSPSVIRISGDDRYEVSASISRSTYWVGTNTVYIASGAVYSDALSGSAAAAHHGSPILLTAPNVLPDAVKAELQRLKPQRIVILGGTGSVSNGVLWQLQNYAQ